MKELIARQILTEEIHQRKDDLKSSPEPQSVIQSDSITEKEEKKTMADMAAIETSPSIARKPENSESNHPPAKRAKVRKHWVFTLDRLQQSHLTFPFYMDHSLVLRRHHLRCRPVTSWA